MAEILKLLDGAIEIVQTEIGTSKESQPLEAIKARLQFRRKFLAIVSNNGSLASNRRSALESCRKLLPTITASMSLGKELPQAFSTRIQRRLSIQVPPRPMVSIDPKEAAKSLKTMLGDLLEIESIYEYKSPHEIIVHTLSRLN